MEGGFFSGQLLIAMPGISDPRFERALILICAHDADHAMGLTLNRPVEGLTVRDVLERLGVLEKQGGLEKLGLKPTTRRPPDLVLIGGPVQRDRGFVLHSTDYPGEHSVKVGGDLALSADRAALEAMAAPVGAPARSLLALGYAGWGAGQLEDEIKQNVWLICEADEALIFGHAHETKWTRAVAKLGVDPERLSSAAGRA